MKKFKLLLIFLLVSSINFAQAPQRINYQAVVRDANGASVVNQLVGIKITIHTSSAAGPIVYSETHGATTNAYGLVNLQIGGGTVSGPALSTVAWGTSTHFVKIEIDPTGGTAYTLTSSSQLVSVPYALYAKNVENNNDADADPTNEFNSTASMNGNNLEITDGGGTITVNMTNLTIDPDMSTTNELQTLSKVGQVVSLSNGGGAFTDDVNDADSSPTNELNGTMVLVGTTLQLTDAGGTLSTNLASLVGSGDPSSTNELNTSVVLSGTNLQVTDAGGTITTSLASLVNDADSDPANELQTISKAGTTVTLSNGGGSFTDAVNDADADPSNELQTISKVGNLVTLSNSGGSFTVDDADASATNEFNTSVTLTGANLNVTDGGGTITVDLSSLGGGVDPSITNELNTGVVLSGTNLEVTDAGGTITTSLASLVNDADADPTNEYNTNVALSGTDLLVTDGGGTFTVDLSSLGGGGDPSSTNELNTSVVLSGTNLQVTDAGGTISTSLASLVNDADADPSNELQTISKVGTTVTLSNGGGSYTDAVNDADADPSNELQTIAKVGTTVTLSNGGGSFTDAVNDADSDPNNELITGATLVGTDLNITDAGGTTTVDLSSLSGGFVVGQHFGGGIIVYVDTTGIHGIIAGLTDIETAIVFEEAPNDFTLYATSFTDGSANTAALVGAFGAGTYAAQSCVSYSGGGHTDWYLPAAYELEILLNSNYILGSNALTLGQYYWSSTEDPLASGVNSYRVRNNTHFVETTSQLNTCRVRPVRAF